MPKCNQKWSPAACHWKKKKKNSKEAKLMERKVCFIFDAGPKANSCPDDQMTRAFLDGGRRLHVETIVNS